MSDPTAPARHPLAPEELPYFIPTADGSDAMFGTVVVFVLLGAFIVGTLYFRLHALPEKIAHGANRAQLQLVAILALLALFTHQAIFWIAALLLAAAQFPDLVTPITSAARSLAKAVGREYEGDVVREDDLPADRQRHAEAQRADAPAPSPSPAEGARDA